MDKKPLHIVSFDNPYPPVYGGVIDVFYKLRALHSQGFDIYLHCVVDEKMDAAPELSALVKQIFFYKRNKKGSFLKLFSTIPFAAKSRYSDALAANLKAVQAPILFEGLQTTVVLWKHDLKDRKVLLRLHNLEANYFAGSAASETNPVKKALYASEARKYKSYQKIIGGFDKVLTLSVAENSYVESHFGNAVYVPVFHGNLAAKNLSAHGKFALYHGDLRLPDNKRAVVFLVNMFSKIPDYSLVIASGSGAGFVRELIAGHKNISFQKIDDQMQLDVLLNHAHINVMLSFQESGTKLKLVNALYKSRFCIINRNMADDVNLQQLCTMAETESEFIAAVNELKSQPYEDFERRNNVLHQVLNDTENALKIARILEI